ncbi:hypothetical protein GZH47_33095 (plasmid) [Paenibacillus rhizovicinus]|uniref:Macro domain-containing protein n=1 Tax=Paenibacillus rhizovicinus TaxID=2704463 RepID=A0A6C0PBF9_9BACL|nr:hypothetical protein [Paenibacillus rhizovicinus]QHW35731.1 hypothetical protein GZH47_33095 [Paenibacillus rhizovicinus]
MIKHMKGNLLLSDCNIIGHQANCFSTMGSGIAHQIAKMYPIARNSDTNYPAQPRDRLGSCSYAVCKHEMGEGRIAVFNLYGQYDYGRENKTYTNYQGLRSALNKMMQFVQLLEEREVIPNPKIGLPYRIGAGLARGQWTIIESMIKEVSDFHGRTIYLYEL